MLENNSTKIPFGIKVLSISYFISAFLGLFFIIMERLPLYRIGFGKDQLFGRTLLFFGKRIFIGIGNLGYPIYDLLMDIFRRMPWIVIIFIFVALAVISFFTGIGILRRKKWARIMAIIFALVGIIFSFLILKKFVGSPAYDTSYFILDLFGLVISIAIILYLLLSKRARASFSQKLILEPST